MKNWIDEFDLIYGHRAGWYQRPMSPSLVKVVQALEKFKEEEIRSMVLDILGGRRKENPENLKELLKVISDGDNKGNSKFILRAPTGRKAEDFFYRIF